MELILDQGNTLLKLALFHGDKLLELQSYENLSANDLTAVIQTMRDQYSQSGSVDRCIFSTVTATSDDLISILSDLMHVYILSPNLPLPITLLYKTPETLGNDRIALATGAASQLPEQDILVIDAGTCITYDFINRNKEYLGGAISPGISMRFKAVNTFTSKLPLVNQIKNPALIGNTTTSSIQSGVLNGVKAEVMGIIQQYNKHYPSLKVILTGGDLKYFDKIAKSNIFANSNLLLLGLKEILEYNAKL
ncbi:MAG: type III pantothenate kinase [Bacteroidetes bacterium]|nr:type III pantothenate kinase [Bacteroidota bacterium]